MSNNGLQQVFFESVSAVTATNTVELGTERWEGGVKYIYVYNKSTSTATTKYGVVYSAASGYSITVSSVANEGLAGVVVHNDIPTVNYGWIATKGHVHVTSDGLSAIGQGSKLIMGALGLFTKPGDDGTDGTGHSGIVVGWATGSTTTAGTFAAFINAG